MSCLFTLKLLIFHLLVKLHKVYGHKSVWPLTETAFSKTSFVLYTVRCPIWLLATIFSFFWDVKHNYRLIFPSSLLKEYNHKAIISVFSSKHYTPLLIHRATQHVSLYTLCWAHLALSIVRRPFKPAASLWYWLFSSWEQPVFIGFSISRILVVACLTFNSEILAKAASSPSLTSDIS